jgi:hypothetical protein
MFKGSCHSTWSAGNKKLTFSVDHGYLAHRVVRLFDCVFMMLAHIARSVHER